MDSKGVCGVLRSRLLVKNLTIRKMPLLLFLVLVAATRAETVVVEGTIAEHPTQTPLVASILPHEVATVATVMVAATGAMARPLAAKAAAVLAVPTEAAVAAVSTLAQLRAHSLPATTRVGPGAVTTVAAPGVPLWHLAASIALTMEVVLGLWMADQGEVAVADMVGDE